MRPVTLNLDLRVGGLGDIWMRVCALFTASKLYPQYRVTCVVPSALQSLCASAFDDRLEFAKETSRSCLTFTTRGLRHLLPEAVLGKRFVVPYHRVVIKDWNRQSSKDLVNERAFAFFDALGWTQLPPWTALEHYQGYFEVVSIKNFRKLEWRDFVVAAEPDFEIIFQRLNRLAGNSVGRAIYGDEIAVFPSGTAHQFMPPAWAKTNLSTATFHIHVNDTLAGDYRDLGLSVQAFSSAAQIVEIASKSRYVITTDSFPAHILQYCSDRTAIVLCEAPRQRIVSPFFKGTVIDSAAPCSPCPHLARGDFPLCKAGQEFCLTWNSNSTRAAISDYLSGGKSQHPMGELRI